MQTVWSGLHYQFVCHVLKALFFLKIALKLSHFWKINAKFSSVGGSAPRPPNIAPHCEFLSTHQQLCTVSIYMRFWSFCFEQFFLDRSVANLIMLIKAVCLMLNCFVFEKSYLHYALCDFDSILLHCTKLFICQSIDCEQIFYVTFEPPPPPPPYWKILRTPLVDPILNTLISETTWRIIMKLNSLYVEVHKFYWLNLQRKVQIFVVSMTDFHKCSIWAPPVSLHRLSRCSWWPFHLDHPTFLRVIFSSRVMWKD